MQQSYINRSEAAVVQSSYEKYKSSRRVRSGLFWAFMNLILAAFAVSEILYGNIFQSLNVTYQAVFWYIEVIVAIWCSLRFLSEMLVILSWLMESPIILTTKQYQLLAVNPRDSRFSPVKPNTPQDPLHEHSPCTDTHNMSPVIPISSPSTVSNPWSMTTSPTSPMQSVSPAKSFGMTSYNMSASPYGSGYQTDMSTYHTATGNMTLRNRLMGNNSPYSPSKFSPVHYNDITMTSLDTSHLNKYPSPSSSPFSDDRIRNVDALNSYLQAEDDRRDMSHRDGYSSMANTSGLMNMSHSPYQWHPSYTEYSTPLSVYKIGTRSPLTATAKDEDEFGHMSPQAEELWLKFGATRQDLDIWTENLRKWISQTVLCKLVKEMDEINVSLQKMGSSELQIGLISLGSLRQVSTSKAEHVPTLAAVLPYLELSYNQEYLVKRIKELGQDSCMGAYRWKSGSDYRGRRWDQDLPTDAQIVMHVFCTYMDSRLPTDARFQDGRTFTGLYFLKNLDKPESRKRDLAIHRFRQNPPHFKVISGDEVHDVGQGRNNLFHSIILFLLMVKRKQHGMLGRVNLGPSGVNILAIFSRR